MSTTQNKPVTKNKPVTNQPSTSWPRMVADIGGTNARFALEVAPQQIEQVLPSLVPALLQIRHVHKNHFKAQVRHLMERLLRRFGEKAVSAHVDPENQRLIANIRKRKERAKRRRAHADGGEDETEPIARSGGMDAFEDALYGSDSDDSDEEEEEDAAVPRRSRHREDDTYLLEDDDAPMDLLDEAAARVKMRVTTMPEEILQLEKQIHTLEIEKQAILKDQENIKNS